VELYLCSSSMPSRRGLGSVIHGNQKVPVHLMISLQKVQLMFKVSPVSLQTFIDTSLTLTPSVIPNYKYVIMVSD
jgi:hypothetical protein